MKQLLSVLALVFSLHVFAQKDFEGMIRYTVTDNFDRGDDEVKHETNSIRIFFTPGKILIKMHEEETPMDLLLILDSAKSYRINHKTKTYFAKYLHVRPLEPGKKQITVLNHTATLADPGTGISFPMGGRGNFWFADDLHFHIPPELAGNEDLIMVNDNKLLLKGEIIQIEKISDGEENNDNAEPPSYMTIEAVEIIPGGINPSDFIIPADYNATKSEYFSESADFSDSTTVTVDTVMIDEPVPPPPPPPPPPSPADKKPVPSKKTKTPAKSPARKE